ncbi:protein dmp2 [Quercus suber]|uniref:Protein dmp2 n=1 Tax=Quercus suber TaxID=58331 RepID=A0AAW0M0S0_QUESU
MYIHNTILFAAHEPTLGIPTSKGKASYPSLSSILGRPNHESSLYISLLALSQSSQTTIKDKTLSGLGNLIRLLPTGTVFLFQFLSPVLSNNGHCTTTIYKYTAILVALCSRRWKSHYGVVTSKGLWPSTDSKNVDLSTYKLRIGDFVHGLFALSMFGVLELWAQKLWAASIWCPIRRRRLCSRCFLQLFVWFRVGFSCSSLTNAMELDTLQVPTLHRFPSLMVAKYH